MNFRCTYKVVFIDSTVADHQTLASGAMNGAEVIILNPEQNGIAQITDYLSKNAPVDSIHIVSHGEPATLYLGNTTLSLNNLNNYQEHLSKWSAKAIYLYGCNVAVGDAGEEFVTKLHEITGASIAASNTLTGNAGLGGDWNLEVTKGEITSDLVFSREARQTYAGVLATYVVDIIQDQNDGFGINGTSLREAISAANDNAEADTIVFDSGLYGKVINLTNGSLIINDNLTINGNRSNLVSISGSNKSRVFTIGSGNVTLNGLKIINGSAGYNPYGTDNVGGGISSNNANLTVINSIIANNQASNSGGGIYTDGTLNLINSSVYGNSTPISGGGIYNDNIITIINSTISSNSANFGGGIYNAFSNYIASFNNTITKNAATSGGGGIASSSTNTTSTLLANTIVAGNSGTDVDYVYGGYNSIISSGNNLIGNGNAAGGFNQLGDQTGVTNPLLGPLTNNGGGTPTHAPLNGSPAINAGSNIALPFDTYDLDNDSNTNERLPVDQTGDDRIQDGVVDIGAVESSFDVAPVGTLAFSNANYQVNEEGNPIGKGITINRTAGSNGVLGVVLQLSNGTAIAPIDYNNSSISISFATGETSKTVPIPIVNDRVIELNENINLTLSNATGGATLGTQKTAKLTIVDNDSANGLNQTGTLGHDSIRGSIGNDSLYGNEGHDSLDGSTGNDSLYGNEGHDSLDGSTGNDSLYGNEDNDALKGSTGNDSLEGGDGSDNLQGETGNDSLDGGDGPDSLDGGDGPDSLDGSTGNDALNGRIGNDFLDGGTGIDFLDGGLGNDSLNGGTDNDTLTGGEGNDTLDGWTGNDTLDGATGNDSLDGGEGNDTLNGWTGNDTLIGRTGNDSLNGWTGNDTLIGREGNDTLDGGEGNDTLNGWTGNDSLTGGTGDDELSGWDGNNSLDGGSGNDTLNGWTNNDFLTGGIGNDNIRGLAGNDTIDGALQNDLLTGGQGNDSLIGGDGNDTLTGYGNVEGELDELDGGNTGNDMYVLDYDLGSSLMAKTNNSYTDNFESKAIINLAKISQAKIKRMKKTDKIKVKSGNYSFQQSGNHRRLYRILPSSTTTQGEFLDNSFSTKGPQEVLLATILNNNWVNSSYLLYS